MERDREMGRDSHREREAGRDENERGIGRETGTQGWSAIGRWERIAAERTNELFINEGNGIRTIPFFIQPSGREIGRMEG